METKNKSSNGTEQEPQGTKANILNQESLNQSNDKTTQVGEKQTAETPVTNREESKRSNPIATILALKSYSFGNPDRKKRIAIWLIFSVFFSIAPALLAVGHDLLAGYSAPRAREELMCAVVLAVVAIAANGCGNALGKPQTKWMGFGVTIVTVFLGCWLYTEVYSNLQVPDSNPFPNMEQFFCYTIIALILNAVIGVYVEW